MALTKISSNEIQPAAITSDLISADVSLGVKISNVSIANSTYTVLDDTAVNVGGGYIVITGAGFNSGAQVIIGGTNATSVTRVSSTELRAQVPAKSAATYNVYVVNTDGSTGIRVNGLTYSGLPTWVTGSTLDNWSVDVAANVTFDATGAVSYANTTALPAGTTLLSNGYFYGTVTGIESDTTYSFTVRATDDQNQDSDRTFDLTVDVVTDIVAEVLIVAGGGGGGVTSGGSGGAAGGGAGGLLYYGNETPKTPNGGPVTFVLGQSYSINVGAGGTAENNGSDSRILGGLLNLTATGGGRGAAGGYGAGNGGSGGGATNNPFGTGITGQGNNGGTSTWSAPNYGGGGGGGAGAVGGSATGTLSGDGGVGLQYSISGSATYYAGGGGGDGRSDLGTGGLGGGGNARTSGTNGLGGGGGAGGEGNPAGAGGSGVVIIRYSSSQPDAVSTTGSPTYTNSGGYKTYTFTGNGSITW